MMVVFGATGQLGSELKRLAPEATFVDEAKANFNDIEGLTQLCPRPKTFHPDQCRSLHRRGSRRRRTRNRVSRQLRGPGKTCPTGDRDEV